ncbi:HAD family hydrolase [Infirmifilum sp. NZ]|uniref:HAD family hydrolase n=1 Tax=Infirmifilum sp. NZ TaxID=2926850 RepID=UPI0027A3A29A|nr:HAD family hydrolase [Infirmifilum sp. NZ]UNQ73428.1 HAD family hydrolase [Infirmifilum sp. NZ]
MKAVSFDVWSTLMSIDVFYRAVAEALAEATGRDPGEVFNRVKRAYSAVKSARRAGLVNESRVVQSSTEIFLEALGIASKYELYWAVARAVNAVDARALPLDGAAEALQELSSQGYALAVTSNVIFWPGYLTRVLLDKAGLGRFFRVQVYADEVGTLKPSVKPFQEVLQALGASPSEAVHVGDSPQEDLAGALNAGMGAVLLDWGREKALLDARLRVAVVGSLGEVPSAVAALLQA